MRPLISTTIVLFWLAMMASLVIQHVLPERRLARYSLIEPEILALQWWDVEEWMWIKRQDRTVGATRLTIIQHEKPEEAPIEDCNYLLIQNTDLRLAMLPLAPRLTIRLTLQMGFDFKVAEFAARFSLAGMALESEGFVEGNRLYYRVVRPGTEPLYGYLQLGAPLSLLSAVQPLVTRHFDLQEGQSFYVDVLDPLGRLGVDVAQVTISGRELIELDGREVSAFRVDAKVGDITTTRWVDSHGSTLRADLFQGFITERAGKLEIRPEYPRLFDALEIPDFDRGDFRNLARFQGEDPSLLPGPAGLLQGLLKGTGNDNTGNPD